MPTPLTITLTLLVRDLLKVKDLLDSDVFERHMADAKKRTNDENQRWLQKSLEDRKRELSTTIMPPGWWQWDEGRREAWLEERAKNTQDMLYDVNLQEVYGVEFSLPCRYEVCGRCQGEGVHDDPNFDGFTQSEWAECEMDFKEDYLDGRYDVTCYECGGKRVMPVVAEDQLSDAEKRVLDWYEKECEADWEYDRIAEQERRMGA